MPKDLKLALAIICMMTLAVLMFGGAGIALAVAAKHFGVHM